MENRFPTFPFTKRLKSMLKVDFRRMLSMPFYYIMVVISVVIPILILVMTTLMVGTESVDHVTGEITIMEPIFTNVWQAIAPLPNTSNAMSLDITTMCNIDMMFFAVAVLICIFISEEFRSGYTKNLFTVRANKMDYVVSKTLVGIIFGATLIIGYFIGAMIGGAIAKLPFDFVGFDLMNVLCCILSKVLLVAVFVPIFVVMSVVGKQKTWLSMILSIGVSMLLFMMISSISPLNSTPINVILSLVGGLLFSIGIGAISNLILKKTPLV